VGRLSLAGSVGRLWAASAWRGGSLVPGGDWRAWLTRNRGKLIGSLIGFFVALAIKKWGILWTLFIGLAVLVGYLVGRYTDGDHGGLAAWFDRLLPPGRR